MAQNNLIYGQFFAFFTILSILNFQSISGGYEDLDQKTCGWGNLKIFFENLLLAGEMLKIASLDVLLAGELLRITSLGVLLAGEMLKIVSLDVLLAGET